MQDAEDNFLDAEIQPPSLNQIEMEEPGPDRPLSVLGRHPRIGSTTRQSPVPTSSLVLQGESLARLAPIGEPGAAEEQNHHGLENQQETSS